MNAGKYEMWMNRLLERESFEEIPKTGNFEIIDIILKVRNLVGMPIEYERFLFFI